ncbi:MAG: hypothetical protein ACR2GL_00680 [Thermoleophilaceae bacterium]
MRRSAGTGVGRPHPARDRPLDAGDEPATHPVVYSARGSHASYPRAGDYAEVFRIRGRPALEVVDHANACPDCPVWRTWRGQLLDARAQGWYGFGGAWGKAGRIGGTTGPLGPSGFKLRALERPPEDVRPGAPPVATEG